GLAEQAGKLDCGALDPGAVSVPLGRLAAAADNQGQHGVGGAVLGQPRRSMLEGKVQFTGGAAPLGAGGFLFDGRSAVNRLDEPAELLLDLVGALFRLAGLALGCALGHLLTEIAAAARQAVEPTLGTRCEVPQRPAGVADNVGDVAGQA